MNGRLLFILIHTKYVFCTSGFIFWFSLEGGWFFCGAFPSSLYVSIPAYWVAKWWVSFPRFEWDLASLYKIWNESVVFQLPDCSLQKCKMKNTANSCAWCLLEVNVNALKVFHWQLCLNKLKWFCTLFAAKYEALWRWTYINSYDKKSSSMTLIKILCNFTGTFWLMFNQVKCHWPLIFSLACQELMGTLILDTSAKLFVDWWANNGGPENAE